MWQTEDLHGLVVAMLLLGITIDTSFTDFAPIKRMQMMRFTGERWELFGPDYGRRAWWPPIATERVVDTLVLARRPSENS
jgi:hypothetical protein